MKDEGEEGERSGGSNGESEYPFTEGDTSNTDVHESEQFIERFCKMR